MKPISDYSTRTELLAPTGSLRAGVLFPACMTYVDAGESARLSQQIVCELAPIAGRLITPVYADVQVIFVPLQALHVLNEPANVYAGITDVMREILLTTTPLFPLTAGETEISRAADVNH